MEQRHNDIRDELKRRPVGRRGLLRGFVVTAAAAGVGQSLLGRAAFAAAPAVTSPMTSVNDPRIEIKTVAIPGPAANLSGYLVKPTHPELVTGGKPLRGKISAVVLIGEDRGLTDHIKDLTRRFGTEGFYCLGLDYLSPAGGTPADGEVGFAMAAKQKPEDVVAYARQAIAYLKTLPDVGKIGVVGYGKGGARANELLLAEPGISAATVYYASSPDLTKLAQLHTPLQMHYAGTDERHLLESPKVEAALKKAGKAYQSNIYSYAKFGFTDDSNLAVYDQVYAELAWTRTVAWLRKYLG